MYDFFHILQLFTQAMKYLNETGRGHMGCLKLLTRDGLCLEHGFVICTAFLCIEPSLFFPEGEWGKSDTTNMHHTLFNSTHPHLVFQRIKGAIISALSESL